MELRNDFTDDQNKVIDEVTAELEELILDQVRAAHAAAREKLAAAGVHVDPEGRYCHNCLNSGHPCDSYVPGFMGQCKRYSCHHSEAVHNHPY
ncbi:hypothetical protein [Kitasatospora sp. NPDC093679]|uniref:hypothetical protein n=1 Tax=Kitasatospora sp. NPDC093679 TaxID=3154983 RepID=UPI00342DE094